MAYAENLTISVIAGIQCLCQLEFHYKYRPNKNGQVSFNIDKNVSKLFQFMKLVIFKHALFSIVSQNI